MLHIRGFGGNPLGGLSTLTFARRTFASAMAVDASQPVHLSATASGPTARSFPSIR